MKVGIIRCLQTEEYCPGTADFRAVRERTGAFAGEEQVEIVGFINCGGCPGKKAVLRARELVKRGADTIAFASCIQKGTPIGYPCPFAKKCVSLSKLSWEKRCAFWITHIERPSGRQIQGHAC